MAKNYCAVCNKFTERNNFCSERCKDSYIKKKNKEFEQSYPVRINKQTIVFVKDKSEEDKVRKKYLRHLGNIDETI